MGTMMIGDEARYQPSAPMPTWIRVPCIIFGLVLIFAAFMALAVMFNGTERPDLYVAGASVLWLLGGLLVALGVRAGLR